jgi:hypothetical protein
MNLEIHAPTEMSIESTTPFLSLEGEVGLQIGRSSGLMISATPSRLSFDVFGLVSSGGDLWIESDTPTIRIYPMELPISSGQILLTSESPSLTTGPLPKGLELIDNGDGTAQIYGRPARGTAGLYRVKLIATNSVGVTERIIELRIRNAGSL